MKIDDVISFYDNIPNVFNNLIDKPCVIMDDGVEVCVKPRTLPINYIFWKTLRLKLPNQPIPSTVLLDTYLEDGVLDSGSINNLASRIYEAAISVNRGVDYRKKALRTIQEAVNNFTNMVVRHLEPYIETIDIVDYINIATDPRLLEAKDRPKPYNENDIDEIYKVAHTVLMDPKKIRDNGLARAYAARTIKRGQALQAIAVRGKVTDIDASVFPNAISTSYLEGMDNPVDMAMESRSAAMVAVYTDSVIAISEYMARQSQLVSMVLESIDYGTNCGSTDYLPWLVADGDIPNLIGAFYLDESNNSLKQITSDDTHLVGKEIKLRWLIGCKHPDTNTVCEVCYGGMGMNMFHETNIGHYGSAALDQKRSQKVLSIKHFMASAHIEPIELRPVDEKFMVVDQLTLRFRPSFLYGVDNPKLYIPANSAPVMAMLHSRHIDPVNAEPGISRVRLHYVNKKTGKSEYHLLQVGKKGSELLLSEELLEYSKKYGVGFSDGCYVIDLEKYSPEDPVFFSIGKAHSFKEYIAEFNKLAIFAGGNILSRKTPEEWVRKMFRLVTPVAVTNIAHIATICYGISAADPENGDYRVCRFGTPETRRVVPLNKKLKENTLGAGLAYQETPVMLRNPKFGLDLPRDTSPLDVFMTPQETVERSRRPKPRLPTTYHGERVIPL